MLLRFVENEKLPFSVSLTKGGKRTINQNKLQRLWLTEISEQLGDQTPEEVRGYCKLTIGVPILREENEAFRERYDAIVKPLPYEQKLAIMMEPLDMPLTRLMTTKQHSAYLDGVHRHFSEKGIVLTDPGDLLRQAQETPSADKPAESEEGQPECSSPAEAAHGGAAAPSSPTLSDEANWLRDLGRVLIASIGLESAVVVNSATGMNRDDLSQPTRDAARAITKFAARACGDYRGTDRLDRDVAIQMIENRAGSERNAA